MDDATKVEQPLLADINKPTPQEFAKKYQELCDELGYRIIVSPTWISRDDGTFSLVLQYTVGEIKKPTKE